ncbi:lariat debranching enzyme-like [Gossypium arboreum]|uniref:lariat debranching enzyme-like n=1 Tax=Gossypium arboreum TaxID=29729 RepID=UPI0022F17598|nr:lariat debranching enzyme-like [Gossypium arboreum]
MGIARCKNHEASNYLWELYYGGWAAPNIYFLGYAVVVKFGNICIGGLSGIYNARHHERPPYNDNTIRSVYHVREYDIHKLMHLEELMDIFLSHDWPLSITDYGNWQHLVRYKKHFKDELKHIFLDQQGTLGSKPAAQLLEKLRPSYIFYLMLSQKVLGDILRGENTGLNKLS